MHAYVHGRVCDEGRDWGLNKKIRVCTEVACLDTKTKAFSQMIRGFPVYTIYGSVSETSAKVYYNPVFFFLRKMYVPVNVAKKKNNVYIGYIYNNINVKKMNITFVLLQLCSA